MKKKIKTPTQKPNQQMRNHQNQISSSRMTTWSSWGQMLRLSIPQWTPTEQGRSSGRKL